MHQIMTAGLPLGDIEIARAALLGLQSADEVILRRAAARGRPLPPLYRSGVRYRLEAPGTESWDTADRCLRRGWGDCEDLAAWRAAELRVSGGDPRAHVTIVPTSQARQWHAVVRRGDGRLEDPSRRLGMGSSSSASIAGDGPEPGRVAYRMERYPGGWLVRVHPAGTPPVHATAADATAYAAMLARPQSLAELLAAQAAATATPAAKKAAAAALKAAPAAAKKRAAKRAKGAAVSFLKRAVRAALPAAAGVAANAILPGSGAIVSQVLR